MRASTLLLLALIAASSSSNGREPRRSAFQHAAPNVAPRNPIVNTLEGSMAFWRNKAARYIRSRLDREPNTNRAKNVIFFLADGMGIPTVAATRMYMGKEENTLSFDNFQNYGLAKTYCVNAQVAQRFKE